ncbi:uncharacterized protein LOC120067458 [Benincasa hispida]|uniref:uncharacterized protein LOC120067458 n=1 Tax=Benincasa hispida TaxID=102211 RepID=UPI0019026041|nr:uncharacterized protein LOC120067458 [Benincasa hispida]
MPSYVKFLKDILTNKRKIGENETVALTYECSALFQNNIPTKMKDPGSFTLPCLIGGKEVGNALCDLGASINLMPLLIFKKLNFGNARPTTVTLQLADRSLMHPEGKIEDVLVQVDKFIFPTDFIILDYEVDIEEEALIQILKNNAKALGWTLADIRGISPSYCMHKIRLEEGKTGSIERQRRLNPAMKEVVKKEIVK